MPGTPTAAYLGLDLGTSALKGVLITEDQRVLAEATAPLGVARPAPGWSEQAPDDWIAAASDVLDRLSAHGLARLRGIGLSGQMHGATLLDAADQVLRPCILWNDTRAHAEAQAQDALPEFRAITGNIVFAGFTAPKLDWVRHNEPAHWDRVAKVLLPKDYLRLWLTGKHVSDLSDAAGTAWLDTGARDWSDRRGVVVARELERLVLVVDDLEEEHPDKLRTAFSSGPRVGSRTPQVTERPPKLRLL